MAETKLSTPAAVLIAGAVVALAVYERPTGTYEVVSLDGGNIAQINTRTGAGEACGLLNGEQRCLTLFDAHGHFLPKIDEERRNQQLLEGIHQQMNEAGNDG